MAWFTVQYRDKDGAKAEAEFEAADKPSLFKLLAQKRITAISIVSGRLARKNGIPANVGRGVLAGMLVVLGALAAWYFFAMPGVNPSENGAKKIGKSPSAPVTTRNISNPVEKSKNEPLMPKVGDSSDGSRMDVAEPGEEVPSEVSAATNDSDSVEKRLDRPLKSHMEQLISMAIPSAPGNIVPPLPVLSEEEADKEENATAEIADIAKGFENELKIEEKDTDADIERKELVAAGKEEFRQYIKDGYTLRKYVEALRQKNNDDAEFLGEAQKIMGDTLENPSISDEECQAMKAKIDELLERRGLQPLGPDYDLNAMYDEEPETQKEKHE